jgi:hypothetical protein
MSVLSQDLSVYGFSGWTNNLGKLRWMDMTGSRPEAAEWCSRRSVGRAIDGIAVLGDGQFYDVGYFNCLNGSLACQ